MSAVDVARSAELVLAAMDHDEPRAKAVLHAMSLDERGLFIALRQVALMLSCELAVYADSAELAARIVRVEIDEMEKL